MMTRTLLCTAALIALCACEPSEKSVRGQELAAAAAQRKIDAMPVLTSSEALDLPLLSDPIGFAGMAAVLLPDGDNILALGGANFPNAKPGARTPEERGAKCFYSRPFLLNNRGQQRPSAPKDELPYKVGYAAFVPALDGMVIAGGCNMDGHLNKVSLLKINEENTLEVSELPALPTTVAYPAFVLLDDKLYVMGGQESEDSTTCLGSNYVLDFKRVHDGWQELAPMPSPRMLAGATTHEDKIYVIGGCSLAPNAEGKAQRTYLGSVIAFDPATNSWSTDYCPMPETMVASPNPLPCVKGCAIALGCDPGEFYRATLARIPPFVHPYQTRIAFAHRFPTANPHLN